MSENKPRIRKICTFLEETLADGTVRLNTPTRKAAAAAVFVNPFAGEYQEDLSLLIQWSEELGAMLTQKAVAVLGIEPDTVHSLSLIHISEPTRPFTLSRMPSSA